MSNNSSTNINYIDYSNSSVESGITMDSASSDNIASILKNNIILLDANVIVKEPMPVRSNLILIEDIKKAI